MDHHFRSNRRSFDHCPIGGNITEKNGKASFIGISGIRRTDYVGIVYTGFFRYLANRSAGNGYLAGI